MSELIKYTVDERSPVLGEPKSLIVRLTKYQKAMLYKSIEVENKYNDFGILGDAPGTGKTAVMLSLILTGQLLNKGEQSLIIVPQNLISQWESEIKKFCGDNLRYILLDSYYKIVDLYSEDYKNELKTYPVLLAPSSLLSIINSTFIQTNYKVKRIIYDEIDTLEGIFNTLLIKERVDDKSKTSLYERQSGDKEYKEYKKCDISWFISASIVNLIDNDTGVFKIGNVEIECKVFMERFIKCNTNFINKYTLLKNNNIELEKVSCNTILDKFSNILSIEQLDNLNSLSFTSIHGEYIQETAKRDEDVIPILINDYISHRDYKQEILTRLSKRTFEFNKDADSLDHQQKTVLSSELKFYNQLIKEFFTVLDCSCINDFNNKYKQLLEILHKEENTKQYKLKKFFEEIKQDNTSKVLLFSDYTSGFNTIIEILDKVGLKHTDLGKGNIVDIDKAIKDFKERDTQVLMIDSSSQGCGMNLENSTHVVFIHKTLDILYEQIIGRALRPGRTRDLKVKIFLNQNEIV